VLIYSSILITHNGPHDMVWLFIMLWNSLPDELINSDSFDGFKLFTCKHFFSAVTSVTSASVVSNVMRYINLHFTLLYFTCEGTIYAHCL